MSRRRDRPRTSPRRRVAPLRAAVSEAVPVAARRHPNSPRQERRPDRPANHPRSGQ